MPKKRQPQSLLTKPATTAPAALSSARAGTFQNGERANNVSDLLQQLRISQRTVCGPSSESRSFTSSPLLLQHLPVHATIVAWSGANYIILQEHALPQPTTMASVHPTLRNVLDIPESASPRPRPDGRQGRGPIRERRIPGPPPPQSWLLRSKYALKDRKPYTDEERTLQHQCVKLPGTYLPHEKSLQHYVLKDMASDWYKRSQYRYFDYPERLPLRYRETLLSYISIYAAGDERLAALTPLQVLFPLSGSENYVPQRDEIRDLKTLDLTNALGVWLTWSALRRMLLVANVVPHQPIPQPNASTAVRDFAQAVPDSWEDAMEIDPQPPAQQQSTSNGGVPMSLHTLRCSNLRHLSLALDPKAASSTVSWSNLLGLVKHLHTLESLSLAYWPLPTYTPAAAATFATVTSSLLGTRRRVAYGGTNMYSAQENDWRESAGILRSLSRCLYCLKWLDLTGCTPWLQALVWEDNTLPFIPHDGFGPLSLKTGEPLPASIWNGHWRSIEWLGLGVGWAPPSGTYDRESSTGLAGDYNKLRTITENVGRQVCASRSAGKGLKIRLDMGDAPNLPHKIIPV
jgi:hypothetical protein